MQLGATLSGPATLNFTGNINGAPIMAWGGTAAAPTQLLDLTVNDNSTSSWSYTIVFGNSPVAYPGYAIASGCTIKGANNTYGIYSRWETNSTITGNTFSTNPVPVYAEGGPNTSLTLTGNTFNDGEILLDYQFLPSNSADNGNSKISGNTFPVARSVPPSITAASPPIPAISFFDSAALSTWRPDSTNDFVAVSAANPRTGPLPNVTYYPIVNDQGPVVTPAEGASPTNDYPIIVTFEDSISNALRLGVQDNQTVISGPVVTGKQLTAADFPSVDNPPAGYTLQWTLEGNPVTFPVTITKDTIFVAQWIKSGGTAAATVPALDQRALLLLATLALGMAWLGLRQPPARRK